MPRIRTSSSGRCGDHSVHVRLFGSLGVLVLMSGCGVAPTPEDPPPYAGGESTLVGTGARDCPHCPEMVLAEGGSFVMGGQLAPEESPPRRVTIARPFVYSPAKIGLLEWKRCVLADACQQVVTTSISGSAPVSLVSWLDAQQYLLWLGLETGLEYRLLTEAEWEYLAKAAAPGFPSDGLEWTSDCWHGNYTHAPTDGSSWDANGDCRYHVARGRRPGEAAAPLTKRYRFLFDTRDPALGFRVARTLR